MDRPRSTFLTRLVVVGFAALALLIVQLPRFAPAQATSATITFDDLSNPNRPLTGEYPSGVAAWGSGIWYLFGPAGAFTSNSIGFRSTTGTSRGFRFVAPALLISMDAFNGGTGATTVTLACDERHRVAQGVAPGAVVTITTHWSVPCTQVGVSSTNSSATHFDNIVYQVVASPTATATQTATPTATPSATAAPSRTSTATATSTFTPSATPASTSTSTPSTTSTFTPSATRTATTSPTVTRTPSPTSTPTGTGQSTTGGTSGTDTVASFQVSSSADDVSETSGGLATTGTSIWFGNCVSPPGLCDAGLRFTNVTIPRGATIVSAYLQIMSPQQQWAVLTANFYAEATGNSAPFTSTNKPSQRALTSTHAFHDDNTQWLASTPYTLDEMGSTIQEVVNRSDWQSGNALAVIITGTAAQPGGNGSKALATYDANPAQAPKLVVTYRMGTPSPGPLWSVTPLPLISRSLPAYSSSGVAASANDAFNDTYWNGTIPGWVALDLSSVPASQRGKVLFLWNNDPQTLAYNHNFNANVSSDSPPANNLGAYTIDANPAPGGGAAPAAGWVTLVTVTGNTYHSRQHLIDLTGYNWVRLNVTASDGANGNTLAGIDLELHDASRAVDARGLVDDDWIFYGASETAFGMHHNLENGVLNFAQLVNEANSTYFPAYEDGGIGGLTSADGAAGINTWLGLFPGKYVVLLYGGNDANYCVAPTTYYNNMVQIVQAVLNAGRIPIVPTIYKGQTANYQNCGPGIVNEIYQLYANYPQIVRGPDFWTEFSNNPQLISPADNLHPTDAGYGIMRQMYRDTLIAAIYHGSAPP